MEEANLGRPLLRRSDLHASTISGILLGNTVRIMF